MATWLSEEGYVFEIHLTRAGQFLQEEDVHNWVGAGFAIFYLDAEFLMLADLSAKTKGARRNMKAMELLRLSTFEPLTEIFGDVLIVRRDEIAIDNLRLPD